MNFCWGLEQHFHFLTYRVPPPLWRIPISELNGNSWSRREGTEALGCRCDQSLTELLPLAPSPLMAGSRPAAPTALMPTQEAGASWVAAREQTLRKKTADVLVGVKTFRSKAPKQSPYCKRPEQLKEFLSAFPLHDAAPGWWSVALLQSECVSHVERWRRVQPSVMSGQRGEVFRAKRSACGAPLGIPFIFWPWKGRKRTSILWKVPSLWHTFTPHSSTSPQMNNKHNLCWLTSFRLVF